MLQSGSMCSSSSSVYYSGGLTQRSDLAAFPSVSSLPVISQLKANLDLLRMIYHFLDLPVDVLLASARQEHTAKDKTSPQGLGYAYFLAFS